ncbi:MAG: TRAP transporter substrate-binding protein [Rhodospirillaceae bacterium]|nr:TRAP transporter substrate-binding protein [Rhodospirillaceae bacterium]
MTRITRRTALRASAATAVALGMPFIRRAHAQAVTLRFGHYGATQDSATAAAERFKEVVEERSGGEIEISLHPAHELGNDPALLQGVRLGTIDIAMTGNPYFTAFAPEMNVLDLPFLFHSSEHVYGVFDGEIGRQVLDGMARHQLQGLALWEIGFRNLTNSVRPIREPADLQGLKIRTTPNPAHVRAFELLGAVPTPMPFGEVYLALQTGAVDGQENPVNHIYANRLYEVQDHLSLTRHAFTASPMAMNKAKYDSLDADMQQLLLDAALEGARFERTLNEEREAGSLQAMKDAGMQVVEDPDVEAFQAIVADETWAMYADEHGSELIDAIEAAG